MKTVKKSTTKKSTRKQASNKTPVVLVKKVYNRGRYKIVDGSSQDMIEPSTTDNRTEDEVLNPTRRAKLLDLTRNLVRNSSLFNTLLGQLTTNVVSTVGGKVVLSIPNEQANDALKYSFSKYTRNVGFYDSCSLNHLLKRVLREYVIGGDCVLVFDDNLIEDSGKVLFFESNEIVNVAPEEIEKRYGKGSTLSQGKVYSKNGRHIGTIVSKAEAGMTSIGGYANPDKCYFLRRDPNENPIDGYWYHFSSNWRDGRGVSQAASAIATIHQLEDLVQSELLASRRNSQIFCWLVNQVDHQNQQMPTAFDLTADDIQSMSDSEIEELAKQQIQDDGTQTISFNKARENQVIYEALPEGYNAQQLQTQHPNTNIQTMVDFMANRCAASLGLSKVFASGNPTDTDWRSNQLFSYPAILEMQKDLEQVCDWVFNCYVKWSLRLGIVKNYIAEDYMDYVDWQWKSIDSLDPVANENAIKLALDNHTKTYKQILGSGWKETLKQVAYENQWMIANGITPTSELMISGGQTEASKQQTTTDKE